MQVPFKLAANLCKALKSEISYDCFVIDGYRTRTKSPMESFPSINLQLVAS